MRSLLLLSGGADSALLLHEQKPEMAIGYDYGQRAIIELTYAKELAASYKVPFMAVKLPTLRFAEDGLVRVGRNAVMLAHAASRAQLLGLDAVLIGCNATDAERFPDCCEPFIKHMDRAFRGAYTVAVIAPLIRTTKRDILKRCREAGITKTWSCYSPRNDEPCGECYACQVGASC